MSLCVKPFVGREEGLKTAPSRHFNYLDDTSNMDLLEKLYIDFNQAEYESDTFFGASGAYEDSSFTTDMSDDLSIIQGIIPTAGNSSENEGSGCFRGALSILDENEEVEGTGSRDASHLFSGQSSRLFSSSPDLLGLNAQCSKWLDVKANSTSIKSCTDLEILPSEDEAALGFLSDSCCFNFKMETTGSRERQCSFQRMSLTTLVPLSAMPSRTVSPCLNDCECSFQSGSAVESYIQPTLDSTLTARDRKTRALKLSLAEDQSRELSAEVAAFLSHSLSQAAPHLPASSPGRKQCAGMSLGSSASAEQASKTAGSARAIVRPRRAVSYALLEDAYPRGKKRGAGGHQPGKLVTNPFGLACTACGVLATPVWRAGPAGPKTLCNACGVRYMKVAKKK
ncbi:hypothetical protein CEUSTIGMA_g1381.t1 [Chlamydomonas eustigma]|uniref:GATA-type domain-containing protein n=1 Tax=Chlamydomonas eustigma TaxID=1157962 RepID=A0A250WT06_9CHLO|nr:hypothetical protein CEUSTIGMA_g1381.t1 [Chlamydomonas eustigma]|eukprot:GAX73931.1 hypothetical protein CEUSTIGMA_g1381.t1 [Chlamydomonas eustigma]